MTEMQKRRNKEIMEQLKDAGKVDVAVVRMLADMARHGEYPDGTFSDTECLIWEWFMQAAHK